MKVHYGLDHPDRLALNETVFCGRGKWPEGRTRLEYTLNVDQVTCMACRKLMAEHQIGGPGVKFLPEIPPNRSYHHWEHGITIQEKRRYDTVRLFELEWNTEHELFRVRDTGRRGTLCFVDTVEKAMHLDQFSAYANFDAKY